MNILLKNKIFNRIVSPLRKIYFTKKSLVNNNISSKKLEEIQLKKLKHILNYSYKNIPFYKEKFDKANVHPIDLKRLSDLEKFPITSREDAVKNYPGKIVAKGYTRKNSYHQVTSGSTGVPFEILRDIRCYDFYDANLARSLLSVGYSVFDLRAHYLWEPFRHNKRFWEKFGLMRKVLVVTNRNTEEQVKIIQKAKPDHIYTFSSLMEVFLNIIKEKNITDINPKAVFLTGDLVTKNLRERIKKTLNCEVFEHYAAAEFGVMAWESEEHNMLNINSDTICMEIVNDEKVVRPNELGKILVTGLENKAFPLIRYEIGDYGVLSDKKSKKYPYPLLKEIHGRMDDLIILPNGHMSPIVFRDHIETSSDEFFNSIEQYKILQKTKTRFDIKIKKKKGFSDTVLINIDKTIQELFNGKAEVKFEMVNSIQLSKSGKLRVVESHAEV